jgi:transcriptional regulator with XRE-family HTH domain
MRVSKMESDNMMEWLGSQLWDRRENAGLTHAQLARRVRMKADAIYRIEAGEHDLTVRELYAIVREFDAKLCDIFR